MARDRGLMVAAVPLSFPGRGPRVLAPIGRQAAPDVRRLVRSRVDKLAGHLGSPLRQGIPKRP
jgi:hypothetical protein